MAQHKPGSLKQKNKKHKGKDGKRAQIKSLGAGKTNGIRKSAKSNALKAVNSKSERLNRNNQLKKIKKDQVWLQKRTGLSSSSSCTNTKVVAILALSDRAEADVCLQECLKQMNITDGSASSSDSKSTYQAYDVVSKTQFTFVVAPASYRRDVFFALELAKAADILMFPVYSDGSGDMTSVIDEVGLSTLSALKAMGCPDAMFCVDSGESLAMDDGAAHSGKKKGGSSAHVARKAVHQYIVDTAMLPESRILDLDSSRSNNMLARTLRSMNPKPITWRSQRSYLLADAASVSVEPQQEQAAAHGHSEPKYRVKLSGYLRGRPMQVHSLMHLVGVGAGRIVKVWRGQPPSANGSSAPEEPTGDLSSAALSVLVADKQKQDSLQMEAVGNVLMGEQTWPTEEELQMAGMEEEGAQDRNAGRDRRVLNPDQLLPKGMSSYQADWFMDEDGKMEFRQPALDGVAGGVAASAGAMEGAAEEDGEGDGSSLGDEEFTIGGGTLSGKKSVAGSRYNSKGELYTPKQLEDNYKAFPDEIDTPDDVSARVRFARYRALLSFRASPWHPKENLPSDYSRIFQFENFGGAQRRLLAESKAVEQMQMHAALNVRNAQRAAGGGSVCGSVKSAGNNKNSKAATMEIEDVEEDADEGSASGSEGDSEMGSDGEGEGDAEEEGMEVDAEVKAPKGSRPRLGSSASASAGAGFAAEHTGITVPEADDFVQTGQYISLELEDLPALVVQRLQQYGFLLCYALYAHEQKMSVLHFHVQKHASYTEPIKSKDELLFMVGFRSFLTKPVFSESNLNCDKHKFERFLQNDTFSMASCYGPIFVSTCPLLVFKRSAGEEAEEGFRGCGAGWTLVATGSLANVEPDRIMLKKIILTGNPIRVRKKFAVVKHLFYDPQDVRWFKPAELVTKWGLRGHITEPVGTHGLLKAMFSGAIKQNDTVMLILYKRVYPKFPAHGLQIQ